MYVVDGAVKAKDGYVAYGEKGSLLTLKDVELCHEETGICGCSFGGGSTGIYAFGNGYYYVSKDYRTEDRRNGSIIRRYRRGAGDVLRFERG